MHGMYKCDFLQNWKEIIMLNTYLEQWLEMLNKGKLTCRIVY